MADSFADLFRGYGMSPGLGGDQGGGLGGMSNSLIGLGMGLLQPYNPWAGTNAWTNALQGYQSGAALDQRARAQQQQAAMERARLALAQSEAGRQASQFQQEMKLRREQFERGGETEFQRMQRDIEKYGDPARQFYTKAEGTLVGQAEQRRRIAEQQGLDLNDQQIKNWIAGGGPLNMEGKALPAELAARTA